MKALTGIVIAAVLFLIANSFYVVRETQQIIITQFGKPVGDPVKTAGLKMKMPFVQNVNPIEKRILEWDGSPSNMPTKDKSLSDEDLATLGSLVPIQKGRALVENEIYDAATPKVKVFGIELLDIRFKRINYNESVRPKIYDRMISERRQIAERFRSEGNGEAARINGFRERELNKIQSEAYREVEEIRGEADAKATEIYALRTDYINEK